MTNEIVKQNVEMSQIEKVVIGGDLSELTADQRVQYYKTVCESIGVNYFTKPFSYIKLNGKLTLYANKDATDQLRKINGVNIDDVHIDPEGDWFTVTVKGSDRTGRRDVEVGAVHKKDMQGNYGNALMKAVTKAKRRLTLSLCGLGWLDETEVETIPKAERIQVDDNGVIEQPRIENKAVEKKTPVVVAPSGEKPAESQEKSDFDEEEFLRTWSKPGYVPGMSRENAEKMTDRNGEPYGEKSTEKLFYMLRNISSKIDSATPEQKEAYGMKVSAICEILQNRKLALTTIEERKDPFKK